jgi:hypothetical protein
MAWSRVPEIQEINEKEHEIFLAYGRKWYLIVLTSIGRGVM